MAEQSREPEILKSIIDDTEYNKTPQSRNEEILLSILNDTEYTKTPQSREEELLLELKGKIGPGVIVEPLSVTENGTYTAPEGKAYSPVKVNVSGSQSDITGNVVFVTGSSEVKGYEFDVVVPDGVYYINSGAFSGADVHLKSITLPDSLIGIRDSAFQMCSGITSITIPQGVNGIGSNAFNYCGSLRTIICKPITPPIINSNTFNNVPSDANIYVPAESVDEYKSAQYWSNRASYIQPISN